MKSQAKKQKVFIAMSGGVDSSVAAALLKQATPNNFEQLFGRPTPKGFRGYEVIGAHMRCFNVDGCAERDAEDARRVAEQLGIPFYVFDFEDEYKARVVDYMIRGYKAGITPNPDVMCNKEIKFGLFFEKAMKLGADYVATGHYVQRQEIKNQKSKIKKYVLAVARDLNKDQSYFLWTLQQSQLRHCLFPIGEYTKPQVRALAKKFGLLTAAKKDSQGICFLGQVSIRDFLKTYIKPKKGDVVTVDGRVVGTHDGAHLYTIGQRHGFGVGGFAEPQYVAAKDIKKNTITIAPENHPALYAKEIKLTDVNFIYDNYSLFTIHSSLPVLARVRYRQPLAKATLIYADVTQKDADEKFSAGSASSPRKSATWKLVFQVPQKFVAVGQSAVFYLPRRSRTAAKAGDTRGKEMLGGGIIVV